MTIISFKDLREANTARQAEWPGNDQIDDLFRALEVVDEAGEIAGAIKKLVRSEKGIAGSTKNLEDVADEIGDAIVSLDLLASDLGLPALEGDHATYAMFANAAPIELIFYLDNSIGLLGLNMLLHHKGLPYLDNTVPTITDIRNRISHSLRLILGLALALGVDVVEATTRKFNKTSAKYGLATMMEA